uniref:Putative FAD-dependent oxidoreductase n=1 Tax=uncultured bacterium fosmid pJB84G2 TaxID=1478072 RepID=A0A0H3U7Z9_9BACT|nr:putative FAD-dependent oxidoreductase [uncultured bacterium fosmid pJB84G2]
MEKYDVIIVGAGPCGYNAALELVKLDSKLKILLIDRGLDITKRHCPVLEHKIAKCPNNKSGLKECFPACSITNGFGGSGAYSDGKFNITTEFGGWLNRYMDDDTLLNLINYVDGVNLHYGADPKITDPSSNEAAREIERKAMSVGLKLLHSKVRHLGTEQNIKILENILNDLKKKIDIRFSTIVSDVIVEEDCVKGVILDNGEKINADKVLLAIGREGSRWLTKIFEEHNVPLFQNQVDIGVRVECPNLIMEEINNNLYEGKMLFRSSTGNTVRTFCSNPGGHVVMENYEGNCVNVNGHSYADSKLASNNTNFALLVSHEFDETIKEPNYYAMRVSQLANQIANGGVIIQSYGDLLKGRRTTEKRLSECFTTPTLKEAVPSDLSLVLPYKTLQSIIEMIQVLDKITPGIATEHTLLYGVEAKYYSSHPEVTNKLEVKKIKNLYVGGDGAGITRGLAQAGASGVYIARNMLEEK